MCNLYSITTDQAAIAALFRRMNRYVGSLPPMPGVFPDYPVRLWATPRATPRRWLLLRWGMPPPPRTGGPPVIPSAAATWPCGSERSICNSSGPVPISVPEAHYMDANQDAVSAQAANATRVSSHGQ
jgi:putative SOS response-associated peptidase YedK